MYIGIHESLRSSIEFSVFDLAKRLKVHFVRKLFILITKISRNYEIINFFDSKEVDSKEDIIDAV